MTHDTREAITAALAGLSGVTAMPYAPHTPTPGMAWPVWVSTEPYTSCGWQWTYYVLYALPATDQAGTAAASESAVEPIAERLVEIGEVTVIEPALVTVGDGGRSLPAVRFRLVTT